MGIYGAAFVAPVAHNWLKLLERMVPITPSSTYRFPRVMGKVAIDLTVIGPLFVTGFLLVRGLLSSLPFLEIKQGIEENFKPIYERNVVVWYPAQLINFYFVPLPFRVLYHNSVLFCWNTYLALAASRMYAEHHHHIIYGDDTHHPHPPSSSLVNTSSDLPSDHNLSSSSSSSPSSSS